MHQPTSSLTGIAAALTLLSGVAGAAVVEYTPTNPIVTSGSADAFYLNPFTNQTGSGSFGGYVAFCISTSLGNAMVFKGDDSYETFFMPLDGDYEFARLGGSEVIGEGTIGSDNFGYFDFDGYSAGQKFFVGYAFRQSSEDQYNYGWSEISFSANGDLTFYRSAYESVAGADIITPVPEPGATVLTAGGLALLCARRKRRQA